MWTFKSFGLNERKTTTTAGIIISWTKTEEYLNKSDFSQKIDNKHEHEQQLYVYCFTQMNNVQNSFQSLKLQITVMMTAENNNFKLSKLTICVWKINAYEKNRWQINSVTYAHIREEKRRRRKEHKYIKPTKKYKETVELSKQQQKKKKNCLTFLVIKATNISPHKKDHTRFEWQSGDEYILNSGDGTEDNVEKNRETFSEIVRSESRCVFSVHQCHFNDYW